MKPLFYFILGLTTFIIIGFTSPSKPDTTLSGMLEVTIKSPSVEPIEAPRELVIEEVVEVQYVEEVVPEPKGRWIWAKVTAYTPGVESCGIYADGFTSIMVNTNSTNPNNVYGIAANPRVLPYGTSVYVPGYWEMLQGNRNLVPTEMTKIDDTGSAMVRFRPHWRSVNSQRVWIEAHLDVRVRQVRTALNWGVKYIQVFVYDQ